MRPSAAKGESAEVATVPIDRMLGASRATWIVALLALSLLLNYVDRGAIGIAAPLMKQDLQLSATGFGWAVSAFFWVYAPFCVVAGWLCDRVCVYRLFAGGVMLWAVSTLLTGFVGGLTTLLVLRLLLGLGEAIAFPGASKIFATTLPPERRGIANASLAAALAFGPAVGTLGGGALLGLWGWRAIFWCFGAATLLWLVPWRIVSAPLRSPAPAAPASGGPALRELLRLPALWLMGMAHFLSNYGFYFLLAWLPLYLIRTRGLSIAEMTLVTTLGFAMQGATAILAGIWSDRRTAQGLDEGALRRRLMILGQATLALAIAGIAANPSLAALGGWLMLAGFASGLLATNIFAIGQIFAGPRLAGRWVGVQNALGNLSGIVGPILTGVIVDQQGGYGYAFAVAAGLSALGVLCWWKMMPPVRQIAS